jgi:hypothetical protein
MAISRERAEVIGVLAVGWLAGNDELLPVFMGSTGVSEADLRAGLQEPDFHASVLDFLMMDDAWVIGFCDANALQYQVVAEARAALPGGGEVHWT